MSSAEGRRRVPPSTVEWPTVAVIVACYGAWAVAGFFLWPAYPIVALVVVTLTITLQSSLQHEVLHGHPTRNAHFNEALIYLPIGLLWPYRRFKSMHLRHHADERLTDPLDDPESYYQALWRYGAMPAAMQWLLKVNNTMAGRFILGPWLSIIVGVISDFRLIRKRDRRVALAWLHHLAGAAVVMGVIVYGFGMPVWLYLLGPVWLGHSVLTIRTYAEHQWSENPEGRSIIIERSPLSLLFLNNNLHLVHHKLPTVAWYHLPKRFRERRDDWTALNGDYVFPNYLALFRAYAFRAKEPVVHPVLRRSAELGRAFRPRIRAHSVSGLGAAPVPAQPPKE